MEEKHAEQSVQSEEQIIGSLIDVQAAKKCAEGIRH